jgi:CTP synthase (UTP-ammonia lyase)
MAAQLWDGDFVPVATGPDGAVRAVMRRRHPFLFGTLYQPELQALLGQTHPLIKSLVRACLARIERTRDTPAAVVAT